MVEFEQTWSDDPIARVDGKSFTMKVSRDRNLWQCSTHINGKKLSVSSAKRARLFAKMSKSIKAVLANSKIPSIAPAVSKPASISAGVSYVLHVKNRDEFDALQARMKDLDVYWYMNKCLVKKREWFGSPYYVQFHGTDLIVVRSEIVEKNRSIVCSSLEVFLSLHDLPKWKDAPCQRTSIRQPSLWEREYKPWPSSGKTTTTYKSSGTTTTHDYCPVLREVVNDS